MEQLVLCNWAGEVVAHEARPMTGLALFYAAFIISFGEKRKNIVRFLYLAVSLIITYNQLCPVMLTSLSC